MRGAVGAHIYKWAKPAGRIYATIRFGASQERCVKLSVGYFPVISTGADDRL
jgi:hypothetical protein